MPDIRYTESGTAHESARGFQPEAIRTYERQKEYLDKTVAWVFPTRGLIPLVVVDSWDSIQWPMNQPRTPRIAAKAMEVGAAYEELFDLCVNKATAAKKLSPAFAELVSKMNFILTTEEDNIIPPNAVNDLFAAIYTCIDCGEEIDVHGKDGTFSPVKFAKWLCPNGHKGLDAVGGLYWTKGDGGRPMAYGDPKVSDDFRPVSVGKAIENGKVIEVNGVAQGCTLFRKGLFRKVRRPWFKTQNHNTQDLYFCQKARKQAGARFAVACGVRVGHHDVQSGETW